MQCSRKFRKKKAGFGCGENLAKGVPFNSCVGRGRGDKSEGRITSIIFNFYNYHTQFTHPERLMLG